MSEAQKTEKGQKTEHIEKPQASNSKPKAWVSIVKRFHIVGSVFFVAALLLGTSIGIMISATTPSIPTVIEPGSMVQDAKFIVFSDGGSYYAKNGQTGAIAYSGTNPTTVIQSAISALTPTRTWLEKVSLFGDFTFSPPTLTFAVNVTSSYVILEGANARLFLADSSSTTHYGIIGIRNVHDIVLDSLRINANGIGQGGGLSDSYQNGLLVSGVSSNITIKNCFIQDAKTIALGAFSGIWVGAPTQLTNIQILNNVVMDGRIGINWFYNSIVSGNYIEGAVYAGGIEIMGDSYNNIISNNIIKDALIDGIQLYDTNPGREVYYNVISDNQIINPSGYGIMLQGNGGYNTIKGNQIHNSGLAGIVIGLDNNLVSNNQVENSSGAGVYLGSYASSNLIEANRVNNSLDAGILVAGGCSNNLISNNWVNNSNRSGIRIEDNANYNTLQSNHIYDSISMGIYLVDNEHNSVIGNTVKHVTWVTDLGWSSPLAALAIKGVNYSIFEGNHIYVLGSETPQGLTLEGSSHNIVFGNVISATVVGIALQKNYNRPTEHSTYNVVMNNAIIQGEEANAVDAAIYEYDANQDYNEYSGNVFEGCTAPYITIQSAHSFAVGNLNYVTENSGASPVTGSVSTLTINHGLSATPTIVTVTTNNTGCGDYAVTSKTSSQFVITFTTQPGANTWLFYWYAEV